jgi:hypothetical protein
MLHLKLDWVATGAMLQGIGSVAGAIAVFVAAKLGANTFASWRRQKLTEREIDQAERILTATYNARRALRRARSVLVHGYELETARARLEADEAWPRQDKARQKRLITAEATFERLRQTVPQQEQIEACLPMARAFFGQPLENTLEELLRQFWVVRIDAESWIDLIEEDDRDFARKVRNGMYAIEPVGDGKNQVTEAMNTAVNQIEAACLPILWAGSPSDKSAKGLPRNLPKLLKGLFIKQKQTVDR